MNKDSVLKKEFKKEDVARVRNLVNKDYTSATKQQLGYSKTQKRYKEGDVWEGNVSDKNIQVGNTLGEKMENAFKRGFSQGFLEIVIIGTDLWDIEMKDINLAFKALESNAGVIGPATDGGYYLLGLSEWTTEVFENKKWGTSSVLKDTMQSFKNKKVVKLDYKNDIDNYTDLCSFPKLLKLLDT